MPQPKKEKTAKSATPIKREPPTALKGMHDLIGKDYFSYQGFFEKAAEVALYYGFQPIATPVLEKEELFTSGVGENTDIIEKELYRVKTKNDMLALRPEGTAGVMRAYLEHGMQSLPQPIMHYYEQTFFRHDNPQRGRFREFRQFGLEMIGSDKPINDALIIKIIATILEEAGVLNLTVQLNSIGDKECRNTYKRELINYYKKHLGKICEDCDRRFKENPLRLLDCKNPACAPIKEGAPDSVAYLCESCKKHFKEVLEYVESMGITYTINKLLVRGLDYYSRTVFEIFAQEARTETVSEGETVTETTAPVASLAIASGGRYDGLAKMLGSNKDVPAVGGAIGVDRVVMLNTGTDLAPRIVKKPKMFFIQLGFDAKLKSVSIIEILRKARVPIMHSLSKDNLGAQLGAAEKLRIPYAIILGQKEVIDETVIVRNMSDRSQKSIKIKDLLVYLKEL